MSPLPATPRKLTIELVPAPCWHSNMRAVLPRAVWDKLRQTVYAAYGHACGVCGARGRLECHEIWRYDDQAHAQELAGFIALCALCHRVKHIGLAGLHAGQGKVDYDEVVRHYCRVNACARADFQRDYAAAMAQWRERSRYEWRTELGEFGSQVNLSADLGSEPA